MPRTGDYEEIAWKIMEMLQENIINEGNFRPAKTMLPVHKSIWSYGNRLESVECLRLKQELTDS